MTLNQEQGHGNQCQSYGFKYNKFSCINDEAGHNFEFFCHFDGIQNFVEFQVFETFNFCDI